VRKITKKYGCRNFSDVITRTHELIAYHEIYHTFSRDFLPDESPSTRRITSNVAISPVGGQIEYSRYGPEDGRPLVLLHSLEYGFIPPTDFLKSAKDRGYAVYTPLRPGFGKSTRADTIRDCADALSEFTERLRLRDVTVIAFSTSAPAALYLTEVNDRISQTVLVNYALDVRDKLAKVKPSWLRGLMGMALNSKHSFKFALRMTNRMYRRIGCEKFYEHLYKGCEEDLAYLRSGPSDLEYAGDALFSADEESIRLDFLSSFDSDFPIDWKALRKKSIFCVQGQNTHGVSVEPARAAAERFGFPFFVIRNSGRNCIFHRPNEFFGVLDETQKRRMSA
jgi:pimeloyl-ACP methyl ester carboxylesterase